MTDAPILEMLNISKAFGGVQALRDVSFSCRKGKVHALLGENGAGKSTLIKILAGAYQADSGEIVFKGQRYAGFTAREAIATGISIIYQELNLVELMTVAENIFLGREPSNRLGGIDTQQMKKESAALLERLRIPLSPPAQIGDLTVASQQMVEIARALSQNADLIVMDEPSAILAGQELDSLFAAIRSLVEQGVTIIYISHRLNEVFEIADDVTVLKDGRVVGVQPIGEVTRARLIQMMVGRPLEEIFPRATRSRGAPVLSATNVTTERLPRPASLTLHEGEILGLAGMVGAGRTEVARALFGADPLRSGDIRLKGARIQPRSPRQTVEAGMALVPEDRKTQGLFLEQSIRSNITLSSLGKVTRFGVIQRGLETATIRRAQRELSIAMASPELEAQYLSGGNQQKVVLAKWLQTSPSVIIFDEPTRGVDVGVKFEIYQLMRQLAERGVAILMISSDLVEVLGMSDRILVMHERRIVAELARNQASEERIIELATTGDETGVSAMASSPSERGGLRVPPGLRRHASLLIVYGLILILCVYASLLSPNFLTERNIFNVLRTAAFLGTVAIGETFVIISGGIDLSVGSVIKLSVLMSAILMNGRPENIGLAIVATLAMGAAVGLINGLLITKLRIAPFIVTLGAYSILRGVGYTVATMPVGKAAPGFLRLYDLRVGPVPLLVLFLALLTLGGVFVLRRTAFGRYIYAIGGNEQVARLSGIRVGRVKIGVYVLCSALAALTGLLYLARAGVGDPVTGEGAELQTITAVILGGTSLFGGQGGLIGTLGGVLLMGLTNNVLVILNVSSWYQELIQGLVIVGAVAFYKQKRR
jgi:ABC-type sugar transport system ATPase subunit/ribose/xylose/arabinose/galactoside ABC-type transport system permease subunit